MANRSGGGRGEGRGRGGRGGRDFQSDQGRGRGGNGPRSHIVPGRCYQSGSISCYEVEDFSNNKELYEVVVRDKLKAKFSGLSATITVEEARPDPNNGAARSTYLFQLSGPHAKDALSALNRMRVTKRYLDVPTAELDANYRSRAPTASRAIHMLLHCRQPVDNTVTVIISTVGFEDEASTDDASIMGTARHYLTSQEGQRFGRNAGAENAENQSKSTWQPHGVPQQHQASRHDDPFAEVRGNTDRRPAEVRRSQRANQGLGGDAGTLLLYERELQHADSLPAKEARRFLEQLVMEKARLGAERNLIPWHMFLYKVESHFVLAELSQYELHSTRLVTSPDVQHIAKICINLGQGIRPFTERRPSVGVDDDVILRGFGNQSQIQFRVPVFNVLADEVWVHMQQQKNVKNGKLLPPEQREQARDRFLDEIRRGALFDVIFDATPYRRICEHLVGVLSKSESALSFIETEDPGVSNPRLFNAISHATRRAAARSSRGGRFGGPRHDDEDDGTGLEKLEEKQRLAAETIVNAPPEVRKIFVEGPCGTGKTHTICQSIVALLKDPDARILVVSPSNSAADVVAVRLLTMLKECTRETLLRVYPMGRHPLRCPELLFPFTNFPEGKAFCDLTHADRFNLDVLKEPGYMTQRVVVGTLGCAGAIWHAATNGKRFTHIFFDEVAKAPIAEALGIVGLAHHDDRVRFVFAGDDHQIGPRCYAKCANQWLNQSICRFLKATAVMIQLDVSYRQNPELATLQSFLFYEGKLRPAPDVAESKSLALKWSGLKGSTEPIRFIHPGGEEVVSRDSWINKAEVRAAVNCVLSIHAETGIPLKEMIIFTQYSEQQRQLVQALKLQNAVGPGGVEVREIGEFQGDEKGVVIISTVRKTEDDSRINRRMLNTAMGRAGQLVVIIGDGNMAVQSKDKPWRDLIAELISKQQVDGYDYANRCFAPQLWTPIPTVPIARAMRLQATLQRIEEREVRFQRIHIEDVLANEMNYFVGVVSGYNSWEDKSSMAVRHRIICGLDVRVEEDSTTGARKDFIFDGDLVAVKIDERQTRWPPSPFVRKKTPTYPVPQPDIVTSFPVGDVISLERFEGCLPRILEEAESKAATPIGEIVAILLQPELPPFVGRVTPKSEFVPINRRFPRLLLKNIGKGGLPPDALVVARLKRGADHEPYYEFRGIAPSPFSLGDVLSEHTLTAPTGAVRNRYQLPMLESCQAYSLTVGSRNAYSAFKDETGTYLAVFVPFVAGTFADDVTGVMERQAASRGAAIWQAPIRGVCEKKRIHLTDDGDRDAFCNAAATNSNVKHRALMIAMKVPPSATEIDTEFILNNASVKVVAVRVSNVPQNQLNMLKSGCRTFAALRRAVYVGEWTEFDGDNPFHLSTELDNWADFTAALLLTRTMPLHSLLVRQDMPLEYTGQGRCTFERQEFWVPSKTPIMRGFHAGTGFTVFARVTNPWERYGDVLTQRLLLIAKHLRDSSVQPTLEEQHLMSSVVHHANWLNTLPLVYGEEKNNQ